MNTLNPGDDMPLVLIGAGGHAKVLHSLITALGLALIGVCDPRLVEQGVEKWRDIPVLGGDDAIDELDPKQVGLINGVGQLAGGRLRKSLYLKMKSNGFVFPSLIHPSAFVADNVKLCEGVQIMAGAVVQPDCWIGENSVLNTRAGIDHDCRISGHVHVAPGATVCGGVVIFEDAFIGSGSTVSQGVTVGVRSVVGAGAVLVRNLPPDSKLIPGQQRFSTQ